MVEICFSFDDKGKNNYIFGQNIFRGFGYVETRQVNCRDVPWRVSIMARLYGGNDILLEQWCHIDGEIYNNYVAFSLHFTPFQRFYLLNFTPFQGFLLWQQWQQLSFYLIKPLHILRLNGVNGRGVEVERVDGLTVFPYTEIKVRTCAQSCAAHIAYHLTLLNNRALAYAFGKFQ